MIADSQVKSNKRKSYFILFLNFVLLSVVVLIISYFFFPQTALTYVIALSGVFILTIFIYFSASKLAIISTGAQIADPKVYRRLYNLVEGLTIASGLPMPKVYVVETPAPNAFATGRDPKHASVAVTSGLLNQMNRVELEGVLAHELSHIKNYDIRIQTIAMAMVGSVTFLGDSFGRILMYSGSSRRRNSRDSGGSGIAVLAGLFLSVVAPLASLILKYSLSRQREYLADVSAINMTRYPPGLISALKKLKADQSVIVGVPKSSAHLWIESPLEGKPDGNNKTWLDNAFNTHPSLDSRIAILEQF